MTTLTEQALAELLNEGKIIGRCSQHKQIIFKNAYTMRIHFETVHIDEKQSWKNMMEYHLA